MNEEQKSPGQRAREGTRDAKRTVRGVRKTGKRATRTVGKIRKFAKKATFLAKLKPKTLAGKMGVAMAGMLGLTVLIAWIIILRNPQHVPWRHAMSWPLILSVLMLAVAIPAVVYFTIRGWGRVEEGLFPDIDQAWREGVEALTRSGVLSAEVPVFLVLGSGNQSIERTIMNAAVPELLVRGVPDDPDTERGLHWYASDDRVYLFCTNASCLSALARRWTSMQGAQAYSSHRPAKGPHKAEATVTQTRATVEDAPGQRQNEELSTVTPSAKATPGFTSVDVGKTASTPTPSQSDVYGTVLANQTFDQATVNERPDEGSSVERIAPSGEARSHPEPRSSDESSLYTTIANISSEEEHTEPIETRATGPVAHPETSPVPVPPREVYGSIPPLTPDVTGAGTQLGKSAGPARTREPSREMTKPDADSPTRPIAKRRGSRRLMSHDTASSVQLQRLRYVCDLLRRSRWPLCGINGVITLLPYEVVIASNDELDDLSRAMSCDLHAVQDSLGLNPPVTALTIGIERQRGFIEFARRLGENFVSRRLGGSFDLQRYPTPSQLNRFTGLLGAAFENFIFTSFQSKGKAALEWERSNRRLYGMLCQIREGLLPNLRIVLGHVFGVDQNERPVDEDDFMFSGCYFAATGTEPEDQAFVKGVVYDKLWREQAFVRWTGKAMRWNAVQGTLMVMGWAGLSLATATLAVIFYHRDYRVMALLALAAVSLPLWATVTAVRDALRSIR